MAPWSACLVRFQASVAHIPADLARCRSCTCSGEEHPGPDSSKGRGVPEIDILEAEKNKEEGGVGQVASQSAQFAPFTHDYLFLTDTTDEYTIFDTSLTHQNTYRCVCVPPTRASY